MHLMIIKTEDLNMGKKMIIISLKILSAKIKNAI